MKSAGVKALFFLQLFLLGVCCGRGIAAEDAGGDQVRLELEEIKARLTAVESQQLSLLAKKDDILKKIEQVRVWSRHSGGAKSP